MPLQNVEKQCIDVIESHNNMAAPLQNRSKSFQVIHSMQKKMSNNHSYRIESINFSLRMYSESLYHCHNLFEDENRNLQIEHLLQLHIFTTGKS